MEAVPIYRFQLPLPLPQKFTASASSFRFHIPGYSASNSKYATAANLKIDTVGPNERELEFIYFLFYTGLLNFVYRFNSATDHCVRIGSQSFNLFTAEKCQFLINSVEHQIVLYRGAETRGDGGDISPNNFTVPPPPNNLSMVYICIPSII